VVQWYRSERQLEKIVRFGQTLEFFGAAAIGRSVFYEDLGQVAGRDGLAGVGDHLAAALTHGSSVTPLSCAAMAALSLASSSVEYPTGLSMSSLTWST
jgi:hypothetical protein